MAKAKRAKRKNLFRATEAMKRLVSVCCQPGAPTTDKKRSDLAGIPEAAVEVWMTRRSFQKWFKERIRKEMCFREWEVWLELRQMVREKNLQAMKAYMDEFGEERSDEDQQHKTTVHELGEKARRNAEACGESFP